MPGLPYSMVDQKVFPTHQMLNLVTVKDSLKKDYMVITTYVVLSGLQFTKALNETNVYPVAGPQCLSRILVLISWHNVYRSWNSWSLIEIYLSKNSFSLWEIKLLSIPVTTMCSVGEYFAYTALLKNQICTNKGLISILLTNRCYASHLYKWFRCLEGKEWGYTESLHNT